MTKPEDVKFTYMALDLSRVDLRKVTFDGPNALVLHINNGVSIRFGDLKEGKRPFYPAIFLEGRSLNDDEFYVKFGSRQSKERTARALKNPGMMSACLTDDEIKRLEEKLSDGTVISKDLIFEEFDKKNSKTFKTRSSVFLSDETWRQVRKIYKKLDVHCVIKDTELGEEKVGRDYRVYLEEEFKSKQEGDYGEELAEEEKKKKKLKKSIGFIALFSLVTAALTTLGRRMVSSGNWKVQMIGSFLGLIGKATGVVVVGKSANILEEKFDLDFLRTGGV